MIRVFFIFCVIPLHLTDAIESKCSGENEEYICGTKCPKTCSEAELYPSCETGCEKGCFCKEGYVRNEETGKCLKPAECPTCPRNETYRSYGFFCETCFHVEFFYRCPRTEEYGCYCLFGYARTNETGVCIRTEDCPKTWVFRRSIPKSNI